MSPRADGEDWARRASRAGWDVCIGWIVLVVIVLANVVF